MKRSSVLIILLAALMLSLLSLSAFASLTQAGPAGLLNPGVNIEATAQAFQLEYQQTQLKTASQVRVEAIQAQILDKQQLLEQQKQSDQVELTQLGAQLVTLQRQIDQIQTEIDGLQASRSQLETEIDTDAADHQAALAAEQAELEQQEAQLQQTLQAATRQLEAAQQASPESEPRLTGTGSSDDNGGANTDSDSGKSDREHDEHPEREDEEGDDDHDSHEKHDD